MEPSFQESGSRGWLLASGLAAALVALVLFLLVGSPVRPTARPRSQDTLEVLVRHPDGQVKRVLPGGPLSPGDILRFKLSVTHPGHLTLIGVDSARRVTRYLPQRGESMPIPAGREQALGEGLPLSASLGPERLIALVCDTPLPEARVRAAAESALARAQGEPARLGRLELPCRQPSLLIEKVAPL